MIFEIWEILQKNIKTLIVGGCRDMCDEYLIYIVVGVEICMHMTFLKGQ
jgi:hypothetical protein